MPRLTARGIAFLVVAVGLGALAYVLERPELLPIAAIAVAAPLIALAAVASSRPRVRVGRQLEPVVATEGEQVQVTVTVSGRARAAEWVERVPMLPGFAGPGRLREVTGARPSSLGYRYWPARRGLALVGPLLIEDRDPFALALRVTDTRAVVAQLVLPAVTPLPVGPVPDPSTDAGPRTSRSRERADDDVVTREYRDGDALRRVHWRVTARQGELMVRQDEPQAGPHARLVVDTQSIGYRDAQLVRDRLARGQRTASSPTFEWIVRMAASAAVHLAERGYSVELDTPTERGADAPVADGPVGDVLGELALLELATRAGDLPERAAPGAPPIVVIAGAPDDQTLRWMLAQRSGRAPAVALLAGPAAPGVRADGSLDPDPVRDSFERAGWAVARVSIRRAPDDAWLALLGEQLGDLPDWALPAAVGRG
ncbi:DUF58 domain-containing protein [Microcella humidisoli]|uniref:DUF58 domain-containing protein n=1 Tax=Microcella humidisoli TaxID=2963406 RepID=A0ABY5FWU6_9MICO|nr:DUF58 domain-containing protein [Microcella humidisoli]UTT62787.1 DUF58 domain-containing protein [Microcella humidisoli]